ncbi:MAG: hypothetical protein GC161_04160 [Planctomycetaceae bacterium]|nr:hypothetical protein [Planctomycetaceae bacterium]
MQRIPVIIVSASAAYRTRLRRVLEADDRFDVLAGLGGMGALVERQQASSVDLVLVDGVGLDVPPVEVAALLRRRHPAARWTALVVPEPDGQREPVHWLHLGADKVIHTPPRDSGVGRFERWAEEELLPQLTGQSAPAAVRAAPGHRPDHRVDHVAAVDRAPQSPPAALPTTGVGTPTIRPRSGGPVPKPEILLVASSTGGPNALSQFFAGLPANFPLPIAIVQHMPPGFTLTFAQRLNSTMPLEFKEAEGGEELAPGRAYLAPGDHHLVVQRQPDGRVVTALDDGAPECSCRPAADVLFRSAAQVYGGHVLAVVLTGMGQDGYVGSQLLVQAGAQVLVQDEASSVVWGMPGKIAQNRLADFLAPPAELAQEVLRRVSWMPARRGA